MANKSTISPFLAFVTFAATGLTLAHGFYALFCSHLLHAHNHAHDTAHPDHMVTSTPSKVTPTHEMEGQLNRLKIYLLALGIILILTSTSSLLGLPTWLELHTDLWRYCREKKAAKVKEYRQETLTMTSSRSNGLDDVQEEEEERSSFCLTFLRLLFLTSLLVVAILQILIIWPLLQANLTLESRYEVKSLKNGSNECFCSKDALISRLSCIHGSSDCFVTFDNCEVTLTSSEGHHHGRILSGECAIFHFFSGPKFYAFAGLFPILALFHIYVALVGLSAISSRSTCHANQPEVEEDLQMTSRQKVTRNDLSPDLGCLYATISNRKRLRSISQKETDLKNEQKNDLDQENDLEGTRSTLYESVSHSFCYAAFAGDSSLQNADDDEVFLERTNVGLVNAKAQLVPIKVAQKRAKVESDDLVRKKDRSRNSYNDYRSCDGSESSMRRLSSFGNIKPVSDKVAKTQTGFSNGKSVLFSSSQLSIDV